MSRAPKRLRAADWQAQEGRWKGRFEGAQLDTGVTVLFFSSDEVGAGPGLHVHPYDEVFIIRRGRALYTIGDEVIEASEGDILMGPAHVPHKFENLGPGPLETTDIHLSDRWIQTEIEEG
ncbi:cupin domain-containing protein [Roseovarius sp. SCSIO 43702]|uniref:cupin domain-containing protein n=1 Tax=Roseovarius sp. SCSIO 43702 TaxID=2823043 RepID=UPI001C72DD4B|nr:cupin domain-containing protein [Roseovarius sp. SCSIO 43702]QYX56587.1 cupin domain-containing protein [Roseovarius sp. SCSIO 43702]